MFFVIDEVLRTIARTIARTISFRFNCVVNPIPKVLSFLKAQRCAPCSIVHRTNGSVLVYVVSVRGVSYLMVDDDVKILLCERIA